MNSFALQTKENITSQNVKKLCCKKALLFGILFYGAKFGIGDITLITECEEVATLLEKLLCECYGGICDIEYCSGGYKVTINDIETIKSLTDDKRKEKCDACDINYLKGIFLACGNVSDPQSAYRLEFTLRRDENELCSLLTNYGINHSITKRGKDKLIYTKNSSSIEDFLNTIGAVNASFDIMNEKIKRTIRNNANRQRNFEVANLKKTIDAIGLQIKAIEKIQKENRFDMMQEQLKVTAKLRVENPQASLVELASLHEPPITKSGLNHRIKKIMEFAENKE